jgi:hypothetical protein
MMMMREKEEVERGPSDVWPYRASVENRSNLNDAPHTASRDGVSSHFSVLFCLVIRRIEMLWNRIDEMESKIGKSNLGSREGPDRRIGEVVDPEMKGRGGW